MPSSSSSSLIYLARGGRLVRATPEDGAGAGEVRPSRFPSRAGAPHSVLSTQDSGLRTQHSEPDVRPLDAVEEYRRCQEIQRRAWGISEDGYVMPVSLLVSVHKHGGLVLGAFLSDELIGFSFAFLARVGPTLGLYSQLTAVLPEHQGRGAGLLLKQAQRAEARQRGLELVAWAFDPLQAGNAAFNLARLGARCRRYEVDLYGSRTDALNAGLATDRLIAEWPVDAPPPAPARPGRPLLGLQPDGAYYRPERKPEIRNPKSEIRLQPDGAHYRPERGTQPAGERLELDIPPNIQELKRQRPDLAALWQQRVREAFLETFARGYVAAGFGRCAEAGRCWYVLEREERDAD
ncbi:MAG: hypothetical protein HY690_18010 [Chloroflexi bacterium]|nr:hypothetical protein [Chloroflexota bacterium]